MSDPDIAQLIVRAVSQRPMKMPELIEEIWNRHRIHQFDVRETVWSLLVSGRLILTSDRRVAAPQQPAGDAM